MPIDDEQKQKNHSVNPVDSIELEVSQEVAKAAASNIEVAEDETPGFSEENALGMEEESMEDD